MRNVMKRAWEMAKEGAKKFGGKAIEYIAESLKLAWKEVKNAVNELPKLIGSEKQIKWAEDIREKFIKNVEKMKGLLERDPGFFGFFDVTKEEYFNYINELMKEESASKWIDIRFLDSIEYAEQMKMKEE
ncbi:hypothetical protein DCC39_18035 [Pueribacillus theae]|uniref:Uncharacterized protein n=1 Tax=Pueribacillus theae TaxID=2171751 RepID=A0A2U1JK01_9BACI|nr:hypothetical protein [Pueribacillus theae]PWA05486.1 hypothetical protein DCC39_18035 [Pueribacillus theae]